MPITPDPESPSRLDVLNQFEEDQAICPVLRDLNLIVQFQKWQRRRFRHLKTSYGVNNREVARQLEKKPGKLTYCCRIDPGSR